VRLAWPLEQKLPGKAAPITLLILLVFGALYGGVFTPVETGAAGTFLGLAFAQAAGC
jgi:C4-dicarboxylate transporter, DctM subunit